MGCAASMDDLHDPYTHPTPIELRMKARMKAQNKAFNMAFDKCWAKLEIGPVEVKNMMLGPVEVKNMMLDILQNNYEKCPELHVYHAVSSHI